MEPDWSLPEGIEAVVLDLDGTLVDSVYQHVVAWRVAFRDVGLDVPGWELHGAIGMGGDRLVAHVAGQAAEDAVGDEVRDLHDRHFEELLSQVTALPGASDLLDVLRSRGYDLLLASSSPEEVTHRLLALVDSSHLLQARVTGSQVERSKPSPDLLEAALDQARGRRAFVVGDTVWDVQAAEACSLPCVGLRTGGITEEQLRAAGAVTVHATPGDLADVLRR